ncbi:MAG TPA: dephospho-CoA kinase [Geminicoccaceae bacterium]
MIVLGLTGGIGMGKSTAAAIFRSFDVPVHDADAEVHRLFAPGGAAVEEVDAGFPGCLDAAGGIDRGRLGAAVLGEPDALRRLEAIVHPLVRVAERRFLAVWRARRCGLVLLEIPLLFETGADKRLDAVAVVSAPGFVQAQRVFRRDGMTPGKLEAVRARQMPDPEKRRRADFVIPTGLGRRTTVDAIGRIVRLLRGAAVGRIEACHA